ncbi:MAG: hypothetical protein QXG86_02025 [Candidatus Woesearchaeota archaeon]
MKKRGQITIFIIIGVILLVITAVVFYYQKTQAEYRPKKEIIQKLGPVELYMQSCVDQLAREAIIKLGQTGGYVYLPPVLEKVPSAHIIEDRYGLLKVPMWYFKDESYMPSLAEIEYQIGLYINNSFKGCLRDFEPLKNEFVFRDVGNYSFRVTIGEEDVAIETYFPMKAEAIGRQETYEVEKFSTYIPVRLKRVYNLAQRIFEEENRVMFLENITLGIMTAGSSIPFTGIEFSCKQKIWNIVDIKNELKRNIGPVTQRIRFKNTNYVPFEKPEKEYEKFKGLKRDPTTGEIKNLPKTKPPSDIYDYFHFFIEATAENFNDLNVNVVYMDNWPFTIEGRPNEGVLLKSSTSGFFPGLLNFLCINTYHFVYDVYYPIEIRIYDPKSFGGQGYNFKFAMPVILKNNKPTKLPLKAREFITPSLPGGICEELSSQQLDIRAIDSVTYQEIPRVNISYECFRYLCNLGQTRADSGFYRLRTGYPLSCPYGKIRAEKESYMAAEIQAPKTGVVRIKMTPLKRFNFNITKVLSINYKEEPLLEDEIAFVTIKNEEKNFEANFIYPDVSSGFEGVNKEITTLELIDDDITYEVEIMLLKGNNYIGGWVGNWTAKSEQMYGKENLNFRVYVKVPYPKNDEEIANTITLLPEISKNLEPRFS